jgi:hypothetical protein
MLGLGREMISSYQQKVKDKTVSPADMNGFFRVLSQMAQKEVPIVFENPTQLAYQNFMKDFDIDPSERTKLEEE